MRLRTSIGAAVALASAPLTALAQAPRMPAAGDVSVPPGWRAEVVVAGLTYATDVTFGPNGEMYIAEAGGHTYGTTPMKAPPARILKVQNGQVEVVLGPDRVVPLDVIRNARVVEEQFIGNQRVPAGWDIPEGIIMPITGVTYNPDNGLLYISHRSRYSTYNPATRELRTIIDDLPSWGEFLNAKPIFRGGKMYFVQATQGNLGPVDSHLMKVADVFNKPYAREVPCQDVTLLGRDFWVKAPKKFGELDHPWVLTEPGDSALSGVYVPYGFQTEPGQVIQGQPKCNGAAYEANYDGTGLRVIAWGLRSNFGYRFSPAGRWVTTQNSCNPIPPRQVYDDWEPIYEITPGKWYGWPDFCSSVPVTDPRFYRPNDPDFRGPPENLAFVLAPETHARLLDGAVAPPPPLVRLQPHSAAEGMVFGRREVGMDPENEILVALWGHILPYLRDEQPGFKVVRVNLQTGQVTDFMSNRVGGPGQPVGNKGLLRPIMVEWGPDGALYVVDFGAVNITETGMHAVPQTGAVWRLVYEGPGAPVRKEPPAPPVVAIVPAAAPLPEPRPEPLPEPPVQRVPPAAPVMQPPAEPVVLATGPGIGEGWYGALALGGVFPTGDIGELYDPGIHGMLSAGWRPDRGSAWGLRFDGTVSRFPGADDLLIGTVRVEVPDLTVWSAMGNLLLSARPGERWAVYGLAGAGLSFLSNIDDSPFAAGQSDPDDMAFTWQAGAGWTYAWRRVALFVEGRYVSSSVDPEALTRIPVVFGFTF